MVKFISVLVLAAIIVSCLDPYDFKDTKTENTLVIEAFISGELKKHQVILSRTTSLTEKKISYVTGAVVTITDQTGEVVSLSETKSGIYVTDDFAAAPGNSYVLHIKTSDGKEYASKEVPFTEGPDIRDVYGKYVDNPNGDGRGIQIYVDSEDLTGKSKFLRWNFIETYEVHAPFPSNWVWIGGNNVEFRHEGIDTCYTTDTLRNILIKNIGGLDQTKIIGEPLRYIPDFSHILRHRYSILVQQFALSEESYAYWNNLRTISEKQGSLSDVQPGSLPGNIFSTTNPDETVLGFFDVGKVSEKRIFYSAIDFYDVGFKMPENFRSYCYEIAPILVPEQQLGEQMQQYERTMWIWEVYGLSPNATFQLMPKICCDCRDQGPTERPSFF